MALFGNKRLKLGDEVRDTVTGFRGIAIAKTEYLHGCARIAVQPRVDKDGKVPDSCTFDEPQLELIEKQRVDDGEKQTGGPVGLAGNGKP